MSHRVYVYNVNHQGTQRYDIELAEWKYEIPLLLLPLFFANPTRKGELLYFNRVKGIHYLRRFYAVLEQEYHLADQNEFKENSQLMFEILESLPYALLEIDATDVFNISDENYEEQAEDWLADIKRQKKIYEQAIKNNNLSIFASELNKYGHSDFQVFFEQDWAKYGLGYWNESLIKTGLQPFQENNLWGLMSPKGEIIVAAQFDDLWDFDDHGMAVFLLNQKYGYIDQEGKILFEAQFDDAFDSIADNSKLYACVQIGIYQGVMGLSDHEWLIPPQYQKVDIIYSSDVIYGINLVDNEGNVRLVNLQQQPIVEHIASELFEIQYIRGTDDYIFYCKQKKSSKCMYFNKNGVFLGEYPYGTLRDLSDGYLRINPHKNQKKISVISSEGHIIIDEIDLIKNWARDSCHTFAYRKNGKWYFYHTEDHQFLLENGVDKLIDGEYFRTILSTSDIFLIQDNQQYGLYDAGQKKWLIEPSEEFERIEYLNDKNFNTESFCCFGKEAKLFFNVRTQIFSDTDVN
ncbi:MAG: WG repeat-containing protein [Acinetobacter sp.]